MLTSPAAKLACASLHVLTPGARARSRDAARRSRAKKAAAKRAAQEAASRLREQPAAGPAPGWCQRKRRTGLGAPAAGAAPPAQPLAAGDAAPAAAAPPPAPAARAAAAGMPGPPGGAEPEVLRHLAILSELRTRRVEACAGVDREGEALLAAERLERLCLKHELRCLAAAARRVPPVRPRSSVRRDVAPLQPPHRLPAAQPKQAAPPHGAACAPARACVSVAGRVGAPPAGGRRRWVRWRAHQQGRGAGLHIRTAQPDSSTTTFLSCGPEQHRTAVTRTPWTTVPPYLQKRGQDTAQVCVWAREGSGSEERGTS